MACNKQMGYGVILHAPRVQGTGYRAVCECICDTNRTAVSALVLEEVGAVLGAGAGAGHVAARAAHQLRGLPPPAALGLAPRQPAEVGL